MNYYNEFDKNAAAWLRCLIDEKLIPEGKVDERSITDVSAADLAGFRQCHFFAGIGGWPYALSLVGWPEDREAWTGSCPCQPFSCAGKAAGVCDERHLWPAFRGLVAERRPPVVFGEQVASKDGRAWLAGVRCDLEGVGYAFGGADLCAAGVGAPHIRQRLYWVADASDADRRTRVGGAKTGARQDEKRRWGLAGGGHSGGVADIAVVRREPNQFVAGSVEVQETEGRLRQPERSRSDGCRLDHPASERWEDRKELHGKHDREGAADGRERGAWSGGKFFVGSDGKTRRFEPAFQPMVDGFPADVALLKGFGNAIVPQVAAEFVRAYAEARGLTCR